jgi:NDP-sugar pyrophosphorylase family protein
MSNLTLVVMAAGIGRRYGGLKQIDPVGPHEEIILEYSVYDALQAGFDRVVFVVTQELESLFRERVGRRIERQCDTAYVFQELADLPPGFQVPPGRKKPWGTAHAVLTCRDAVQAPFAVINADDFYGRGSFLALSGHLGGVPTDTEPRQYCMVGFRLGNTLTEHGHVSRGVCRVDPDGYLVDVRERTRIERRGGAVQFTEDGQRWVEIPADAVVSMNIWGFTPGLFGELAAQFPEFLKARADTMATAEFYLPDAVRDLIETGQARVKVLATEERWFGVTYPEDKPRVKEAVRELVRARLYPEKLWD